MQFKTTAIISTVAFLLLGQGLAHPEGGNVARAALIATDPDSACRCPNNCSHKVGSSCKYKAGPSTNSSTVDGKCVNSSTGLTCQPN